MIGYNKLAFYLNLGRNIKSNFMTYYHDLLFYCFLNIKEAIDIMILFILMFFFNFNFFFYLNSNHKKTMIIKMILRHVLQK